LSIKDAAFKKDLRIMAEKEKSSSHGGGFPV
jgi:hypothetical protein